MLRLDGVPDALDDPLRSVHLGLIEREAVRIDTYFFGLGQHAELQLDLFARGKFLGQLSVEQELGC